MTKDLLGVNLMDLHFAVVSGKWEADHFSATHPVIYGTAFPIGPGLLLTASHVVESAKCDGEMGILRFVKHRGTGELLHVYRVKDWEEIKAIDLALIRCPELASEIVHMPMSFEPLDVFDEVSAVGYPFSMDAERLVVVHRGFAGHVVTRREMFHIPGQPPGYELSFRAPRGLSGAPLVARHADGGTYCHGVVVQDMGIDIDQVGGLHVGIAVAADALLSVTTSFSSTGYLATLLGRAFVPRRAPTPVRNPNMVAHEASEDGWPTGDHE